MTAAAAPIAPSGTEYRKAITAGVIGNVLEWYDFGVYGYLVPTISALFFPGGDPTVSLLQTFAVFGVGFVMRPVGSILFGIYGDKHGRRKALSAVIFVMAIATFAMGLLPTYAQAGVLAPALLVVVRLFQGLSVGGEFGGSTAYIVEFAPPSRRGFFGSFQLVGVAGGFLLGSLTAALFIGSLSDADRLAWGWRPPLLLFSCIAYAALGYPFFLMASSGSVALAALAQLLMVVLYAPYAGTCPSFYTEIFPTRVRYTALSIGYNIAVAIFGGFAPFIATFLVHETGSNYAPAFYVIAAAIVTGLILLRVPETAFKPLR